MMKQFKEHHVMYTYNQSRTISSGEAPDII